MPQLHRRQQQEAVTGAHLEVTTAAARDRTPEQPRHLDVIGPQKGADRQPVHVTVHVVAIVVHGFGHRSEGRVPIVTVVAEIGQFVEGVAEEGEIALGEIVQAQALGLDAELEIARESVDLVGGSEVEGRGEEAAVHRELLDDGLGQPIDDRGGRGVRVAHGEVTVPWPGRPDPGWCGDRRTGTAAVISAVIDCGSAAYGLTTVRTCVSTTWSASRSGPS